MAPFPFVLSGILWSGFSVLFFVEDAAIMATIPRASPTRHLISVDVFHRMGETGILGSADRVELIDGEIIDMSPIGALHAAIVDVLARHFGRRVGETVFVRCQNPLRLDDMSEPEPDITILRPRTDFYTTAHPGPADVLLVIEVADTSLAYDLGVKVPLYARHGIPEVWVIDAMTRRTRLFRKPLGSRDAGEAAGSGYAYEASLEPHESLSCAGVVDDAGGRVMVELARLLPLAG
jgi:Uma2 family endonuclease